MQLPYFALSLQTETKTLDHAWMYFSRCLKGDKYATTTSALFPWNLSIDLSDVLSKPSIYCQATTTTVHPPRSMSRRFFVSERENLVFHQPDRTLRPRLRRLQFCQKRSTASLALFNACARSVDYLIPLQPNSLFFAKHTQHMSVSQTKKPIRFTSSSICHSGCFVFFLPFDQFSDF